ncbi:MAG: heavy metal translocating P-type ATPase [Alphaproteobacteria bacterium]|nr:heavy metal translocating P-type ATPase [Alphaproteobacteria bacterium]
MLNDRSRKPEESAPDAARFVVTERDGARVLRMRVEGMHCASCALRIEDALNKEQGVTARVNLATRRLSLRWTGETSRVGALMKKVADLGYKLTPDDSAQPETEDGREEKALLRCLVVAGIASVVLMLTPLSLSALIALPVIVFAGRPFFGSAWEALRHKHTNMDVPISVALVLTTGMSLFETVTHGPYAWFDSAVMLLFLLLIGRYLDRRTRGRARAAAQDLLTMRRGDATVIENGQMRLVPIRDLQSGLLLQVAAGEKIAADGVVESGKSEVDPSFITGETTMQPVAVGARVFGGMINVQAPLTVRLTAASGENLLDEVIRLMEKAEQGHAHFVRLADRVARAYTPVVHVLALATFLVWCFVLGHAWEPSLLAAMTVLIIACPCAMGLAVPAVQVLASGRLFRHGMLLKSADALERLAQVDTIVFDKTGTLTTNHARLANPAQIGARNMQIAASLAAHSKHPLSRALHEMYGGKLIDLTVAEIQGQGLEAQIEGKTVRLGRRDFCGDVNAPADDSPEIWLNIEGESPIRFAFADQLRRDAKGVIADLKLRGYRLLLLSGDREAAVASVAQALGIDDFHAQVSPVDKVAKIEEIRKQGGKVLMVGDGLNDAAALASADVSMSPSSALDIAQNAADIVFQGEKLSPLIEALTVSKRAEKLVRQNFIMSFLYNAFAIPVAMLGLITPSIAAVAMAGSSIFVVLNAQRVTN